MASRLSFFGNTQPSVLYCTVLYWTPFLGEVFVEESIQDGVGASGGHASQVQHREYHQPII